jgi:hypothetical protein
MGQALTNVQEKQLRECPEKKNRWLKLGEFSHSWTDACSLVSLNRVLLWSACVVAYKICRPEELSSEHAYASKNELLSFPSLPAVGQRLLAETRCVHVR